MVLGNYVIKDMGGNIKMLLANGLFITNGIAGFGYYFRLSEQC
jgi:hypothetical protein